MRNAEIISKVLLKNKITKLHVDYVPKHGVYLPYLASHPRVNSWYFHPWKRDIVMDVSGDSCGIDPKNWYAYYAIIRGLE